MRTLFFLPFFFSSILYAQEWSSLTEISREEPNAIHPEVAMDGVGNAIAIWQGSGDSNIFSIQTATCPLGGEWSTPEILSKGGNNVNPKIVVGPLGNAIAVWQKNEGENMTIQAASLFVGGVWSAPLDLSKEKQCLNPQIAIGPLGNAAVVWQGSCDNEYLIQATTFPLGGIWSPPVNLAKETQPNLAPQVVVDGSGNVTAIWQQNKDPTTSLIQSATLHLGGVWSSAINVSKAIEENCEPQICVDPAGTVTAIWRQNQGSNSHIFAAHLRGGKHWSFPVKISKEEGVHSLPQISVDSQNQVTAVWQFSKGMNQVIQASTHSSQENWSMPATLSDENQRASHPKVSQDGKGNALAVWQQIDDRNYNWNEIIYTSFRPKKGSWSTPVALSTPTRNAHLPEIGTNSSGKAVVVWQQLAFYGKYSIILSTSATR